MSSSKAQDDSLVTLGSNQGDPESCLDAAVSELSAHPDIDVIAVSRWHATAPVGGPKGQPEFLNGAVRLHSNLTPFELHQVLIDIETGLGRQRLARWGPRSIDLDLIVHGSTITNEPSLQLPHPRMTFRRFVLEPAVEVAGDLRDPITGIRLSEYLGMLNDRSDGIKIYGADERLLEEIAGECPAGAGCRFVVRQARQQDASGSQPLPKTGQTSEASRIMSPQEFKREVSDSGGQVTDWDGFILATEDTWPACGLADRKAKLGVVVQTPRDRASASSGWSGAIGEMPSDQHGSYLFLTSLTPKEMWIEIEAAVEAMKSTPE